MAELRLTAIVVAALAGTAAADPTAMVHAPDGWRLDSERAAQVMAAGGHAGVTAIEAYVPPAADAGVALFATRTAVGSGSAEGQVELLRAEVRADRLTSASVLEKRWQWTRQGDRVIADLVSYTPDIHLTRTAREIAREVGGGVVAVTGECLSRDDAAAPLVDACRAALDTLDPGSGGTAPALVPPDPTAATPRAPAATMRDAPTAVMPPIEVPPPESTVDRRPIYFGAGLIVLALVFWWNRRRRDAHAHHDGGDTEDADDADVRAAARKDDDK
jgi:hypothetical protein